MDSARLAMVFWEDWQKVFSWTSLGPLVRDEDWLTKRLLVELIPERTAWLEFFLLGLPPDGSWAGESKVTVAVLLQLVMLWLRYLDVRLAYPR